MKVYVFGTDKFKDDSMALEIARLLEKESDLIEFVYMKVNEDVDFGDDQFVVILDTVQGLNKVEVITDIDRLKVCGSSTVHDYDLGFQLKYLKKLGRLWQVKIIGVPMEGEVSVWGEEVKSVLDLKL